MCDSNATERHTKETSVRGGGELCARSETEQLKQLLSQGLGLFAEITDNDMYEEKVPGGRVFDNQWKWKHYFCYCICYFWYELQDFWYIIIWVNDKKANPQLPLDSATVIMKFWIAFVELNTVCVLKGTSTKNCWSLSKPVRRWASTESQSPVQVSKLHCYSFYHT